LRDVVDDNTATTLVAGQSARLLYEGDHISSQEVVNVLARKLSPGTTLQNAAGFFEGFLDGAGERLIHDSQLRNCVNDWIISLDEETFIQSLPLFRRVFSNLDKMERKRLMTAVLGHEVTYSGFRLIDDCDKLWPDHLQRVLGILNGKRSDE
jgi:hypothetical protein